jgi:hypothetical protein
MNAFTVPVSMLAAKGKGGVLAAGVIGLLIIMVLAAKTAPNSTAPTR